MLLFQMEEVGRCVNNSANLFFFFLSVSESTHICFHLLSSVESFSYRMQIVCFGVMKQQQ